MGGVAPRGYAAGGNPPDAEDVFATLMESAMATARKNLLPVLGAALLLTGCVSTVKQYPYGMIDPGVRLMPLTRGQYTILGDVEGRAEGSEIFGMAFISGGRKQMIAESLFGGSGEDLVVNTEAETVGEKILSAYQIIGPKLVALRKKGIARRDLIKGRLANRLSAVEQTALYNAMESQPEADGLIAVKVTKEELTRVPFIFKKMRVTIKGKAVKVKIG